MSTPLVITKIRQYKEDNGALFAWEIREKLLIDGICPRDSLPSVSSINRILRKTVGRLRNSSLHHRCSQSPLEPQASHSHSQSQSRQGTGLGPAATQSPTHVYGRPSSETELRSETHSPFTCFEPGNRASQASFLIKDILGM